jgi:hypothetical protein
MHERLLVFVFLSDAQSLDRFVVLFVVFVGLDSFCVI